MKQAMFSMAAGVLLAAASGALAQPDIPWSVLGGGGGVSAAGAFRLSGTIGQATSGWMESAGVGVSVAVSAGFLAGFPGCVADFNADCVVSSQDYFDFLGAFFSADPSADLNRDGSVASQDFFDFIAAFFTAC